MNSKPDTKPRVAMQFKVGKRFAKTLKAIVRHGFKQTTRSSHDAPLEPQPPVFFDIVAPPPPVTEPTSPRSRATSDSLGSSVTVGGDRIAHIKSIGSDIGSVASSSGGDSSTFSHSAASAGTSGGCSYEAVGRSGHSLSNTRGIPELPNEIHVDAKGIVVPGGISVHEFQTPLAFTLPSMEDSRLSPSAEVLTLSIAPAIYTEPAVPNPFLADDLEDSLPQENELPTPITSQGFDQQHLTRPAKVPLTRTPASPILSANVNKAVPPPPASSDGEDEDETPELSLSGLVIPAMFLPIPNTDPLTTLLTKYIYPPENRPVRDVTGEWQRSDFHTLVMTNSWRALARMARDRIVAANPEDLTLVLGLWNLRLSSLARLRLFNQTSAECTNLFSVLNAVEPDSSRSYIFDRILPFELEVMFARLKYWAGDHMAYLDALNGLLRKCKAKSREAGRKGDGSASVVAMWKERGARVCLIIASQLMEMKDFITAAKLLEPLCNQIPTSPSLRSSIGRIYLQGGYTALASKHFTTVAADPTAEQALKDMNAALLASAEGNWSKASEKLGVLVENDKENYVAVNNLAVALLSQGKLKEGIEVLECALRSSPSSVVVAEPFLFNLSTLYELRSATAAEKKRDLLLEVAKWSGDGLKTTCLKMPTN